MEVKKILRKFFSIDNELTHLCITIFGIKIKIRSNRLISVHKLNKNLHYLGWRLGEQDKMLAKQDEMLTKQMDVIVQLIGIVDNLPFHFQCIDLLPISDLKKKAFKSTMDFIDSNFDKTKTLFTYNHKDNLKMSLGKINFEGLIIECGVFEGETINLISSFIPNFTIYGFDCFEGLPEDWHGYHMSANHFSLNGKLPKVNNNVKLIPGLFNKSLPKFIEKIKEDEFISFLHIDCDLYSSTVDIFNALHSKIKEDTIIVFDEYFNYPNWENGEYKAFMEFCDKYKVSFEYIIASYQQVTVKITKKEIS